jgi:hypothetical protein
LHLMHHCYTPIELLVRTFVVSIEKMVIYSADASTMGWRFVCSITRLLCHANSWSESCKSAISTHPMFASIKVVQRSKSLYRRLSGSFSRW